MEKFFGDGIPINENILAIKNGFTNYKNSCEKKIAELEAEKKEREGLNTGLREKVDRLVK